MQCSQRLMMLRAVPRCVPNICSPGASCRARRKAPHFGRKDLCCVETVKSLLRLNLSRCLCSCSTVRKCWSCGSSAQLFFCSSCNTIQPPRHKATYFEILNCDQTFDLDARKLQVKYLELQRSLHPDNFSQKSQTEQKYSEEQSSLVNKAYRTLQKPLTRSAYLLQLQGVELEEGTDSTADPALLSKVMEVNERLAETQSIDEVNAVGQEVQVTLKNLTEQMNASLNKGIFPSSSSPLVNVISVHAAKVALEREDSVSLTRDLQSAREILTQMKYFANLEEKIKEKLRKNM